MANFELGVVFFTASVRLDFGKRPTPPGNADGCEKKELAGKAIRKIVKTKGR